MPTVKLKKTACDPVTEVIHSFPKTLFKFLYHWNRQEYMMAMRHITDLRGKIEMLFDFLQKAVNAQQLRGVDDRP